MGHGDGDDHFFFGFLQVYEPLFVSYQQLFLFLVEKFSFSQGIALLLDVKEIGEEMLQFILHVNFNTSLKQIGGLYLNLPLTLGSGKAIPNFAQLVESFLHPLYFIHF